MTPSFSIKFVLTITVQLRADLGKVYNWSEDWQMLFNFDKCKIIHFGNKNSKKHFSIR